uniref:GPI mannosyltransferase 2 n=1 Tax=Panagrellus redivivus TaxID=6233 RepID=A0A7E4W739_PANRE
MGIKSRRRNTHSGPAPVRVGSPTCRSRQASGSVASNQFHDLGLSIDGRRAVGGDDESASRLSEVLSNEDVEIPDDDTIQLEPIDPSLRSFVKSQLIFSRVMLIFFQFCFNYVMHDWPTDAFKGMPIVAEPTRRDRLIESTIGGLANWDARHFLHIAEFGYTWESELAFFPLYPTILRLLGSIVEPILEPISLRNAMVLAGVAVSNVAFVAAGLVLFELTYRLTANLKIALIASYVFCWNPASVFFSAAYTESIYCLISFSGMLYLEVDPYNRLRQLVTACIFSFGFATRSNGVLNLGYIGYYLLIEVIMVKQEDGKYVFDDFGIKTFTNGLKKLPFFLLCVLIVILPLRIFSTAIEDKFCHSASALFSDPRVAEYVATHNASAFTLPGQLDRLPWCDRAANGVIDPLFPPYYQAVQEKYWSVGLFGYWQIRKIPFFFVAAPTIFIVFYGLIDLILETGTIEESLETQIRSKRLLVPYALHALVLTLAGILTYNVEVSIRMLYSSTPFICIVLARHMARQTPRIRVPEDLLDPFVLPFLSNYARVKASRFLIVTYLLGYFTIGTMMHVNWLPFV